MKKLVHCVYFSALLFISGCASTPDTRNAVHIKAFNPDTENELLESVSAQTVTDMEKGLVYEFAKGDIIRASVDIQGSLAEIRDPQFVDIVLKRNLWLYIDKKGHWVSLDGKEYRKFDDISDIAGKGGVSISLSSSVKQQSNQLKVSLILNPEDD